MPTTPNITKEVPIMVASSFPNPNGVIRYEMHTFNPAKLP